MAKKEKYKRATLDIETDPFLYGRTPMPFCCGFYDGETYFDTWGDDCIVKMIEHLESLEEPHRIYVHNGGGFDFWYLQKWINNPIFFISKRIAKAGFCGKHELRDSYRMIPIPLAKFNKTVIDYSIMEESVRNRHKNEIRAYLRDDCYDLFNMVSQFIEKYGEHLTMGAAALKNLKRLHPNKSEAEPFDAMFRPYYVGGRCEFFKSGEILGDYKMYDVNSLYPYTMHDMLHPLGNSYDMLKKLPDDGRIYFARIIAESKGALPIREVHNGFVKKLTFPHGTFEFMACSHEIITALELGLLKIHEVKECRVFHDTQKFDTYIAHHMTEKILAEESGDKGGREFSKLFMNTPYGKFGQDPRRYKDCMIFDSIDACIENGFTPVAEFGECFIGEKPAELKPWSFNNVAVAASITSAARSTLLKALHKSDDPLYCDTDSIICKSLDAELHPTKLGAWKHEADFDKVYIAGKKLYAGFMDGKCVKKASKGANLEPSLIAQLATSDESIPVRIDAPTLRFNQDAKFILRNLRRTA